MKNLLFVLYHDFTSNSAVQVHALANRLGGLGWDCAVAIHGDVASTLSNVRNPRYRPCSHAEVLSDHSPFRDGHGADLIHAWTPRELVRVTCEKLRERYAARLIVHLEDNEEAILESNLGRSIRSLLGEEDAELDRLIPSSLSHPRRYREFLAAADGVTLLVDSLARFAPPAVPSCRFWPAADDALFYPREMDWVRRRSVSIPDEHTVLVYAGNVHAANSAEVRSLYLAVALLNREGVPTTLIRSGIDFAAFLGDESTAAPLRSHVRDFGYLARHSEVADLLAMADIFVQPGVPGRFNDYRFPSKLPEYFAMGRPVVLPATNVGCHVRHLIDAYVLPRADALGITHAIKEITSNVKMRAALAYGARAFASRALSWDRASATLNEFYLSLLGRDQNLRADVEPPLKRQNLAAAEAE